MYGNIGAMHLLNHTIHIGTQDYVHQEYEEYVRI